MIWTPEEYAQVAEVVARVLPGSAFLEALALVHALDRTGRKTPEERQRGLLTIADIVRPPRGKNRNRPALLRAADVQLALGGDEDRGVDLARLDDMAVGDIPAWLRGGMKWQAEKRAERWEGGRAPGRRGRFGTVDLSGGRGANRDGARSPLKGDLQFHGEPRSGDRGLNSLSAGQLPPSTLVRPDVNPEQILLASEGRDLLFEEATPAERQLFLLEEQEDLSDAEIATRFRWPVGRVKEERRGLRRLARKLGVSRPRGPVWLGRPRHAPARMDRWWVPEDASRRAPVRTLADLTREELEEIIRRSGR